MTNRFKILAAALGLVIATGAIGDVSAQTATTKTDTPVATQSTAIKAMPSNSVSGKTVTVKKVGTKKVLASKTVTAKKVASKTFLGKHRRIHVAHRFVKHVRIAHRLTRTKIAHKLGLKHFAKANIVKKTTIVR